jgi:hypothetical protein
MGYDIIMDNGMLGRSRCVIMISFCNLGSKISGVTIGQLFITVEIHLSGTIWTASHPDKQNIWIIGFFFENRLHWQFEVLLLLFTECTCV